MSGYFDVQTLQAGLGRQSVRGGVLAILGRVLSAVIQLGSIVVLARLLSPEDYGLVAMVTAITGFAPLLIDIGTRDAMVQRERITHGEASALFWITVGIGGGMTLLLAASGPLVAAFYGEPRLAAIIVVSSLTFLASALISQHQALLRRALMFRALALVEVAANAFGTVVAIAMAFSGFHYWALVTRPVAMYGSMAAGVWLFCRWLPGKPTLTSGVKEMLRFGLHLTGSTLTDYAGRNGDRVAIGRTLGAQALGYYQNSLLFYEHLLGVLVLPLYPIAVASLSKLQNDMVQLKASWAKALSTVAFYAMPAFGLLAVVSQDVIVALLGSKWETAGFLLSILALRGIPHSAERTSGWLHVAAGRSDRWFRSVVASTCGQFLALFLGLPFGVTGVVCAYVLYMYLAWIPTLTYAGHPLGIRTGDVIRAVGPQLSGATVAAGLGFAVRLFLLADVSPIERTAILVAVFAVAYVFVVVGLFGVTTPARILFSVMRESLRGLLKTMGGHIAAPRPK